MTRPGIAARVALSFCLAVGLAAAAPLICAISAKAAAHDAKKVEHYDWQGEIDGKIPVSVWFETRDGLIAGEIVYTKMKEKKPIRLLGTVSRGRLSMKEMLNGLVTGSITGTIKDGVFEGAWAAPGKVKERGGEFEFIDGKERSIRLVAVPGQSKAFRWEYDPAALSGNYMYSYGKNALSGEVDVAWAKDGSLEFGIASNTGAPAFNMADIPAGDPDEEKKSRAKGRMQGNRVIHEVNEDCAFEILFFNDFLVTRYLEGKSCEGYFGRGASIEGHFVKLGKP